MWLSNKGADDRGRVGDPGLKLQTVESSKGLQYRAVVLLWADMLPRTFGEPDPLGDAKAMYVALTRAEDYLFITHSDGSEFVDDIERSGLTQEYR